MREKEQYEMNVIDPREIELAECTVIRDRELIVERYNDLLGDESKLRAGGIEALYLPQSLAELAWAVRDLHSRGQRWLVSAGRTGIAGAAVPLDTDCVIGLSNLNRPLGVGRNEDGYYIRLQPGVTLAALTGLLNNGAFSRCTELNSEEAGVAAELESSGKKLWFPVNPTETSAHIGGIVATNASGARTYRFGATREWVQGITVVLADGRIVKVRRSEVRAEDGQFLLRKEDGTTLSLSIPAVDLPHTKATLGYPLHPEMDLVDLFVGSEGTLGVIAEVELALAEKPESVVGVMVVVEDEHAALQLVRQGWQAADVQFDAIEYFDRAALDLLRRKKESEGAHSHLPDLPSWQGCAVYFEFSGSEEDTEEACIPLEEMLETVGLNLDDTWAAMEASELAAMRIFRHAVPEEVNSIIGRRKLEHPGLHKVGTDMAVPPEKLDELFAMYRQGLREAGIDSVIFGHIGNCHVHVNLLPGNMEELAVAKALYQDWAVQVVAMDGAVAAEHGIGRIKAEMLKVQFDDATIGQMREVKACFDPDMKMAPGVLFRDEVNG